MRHEEKYRCLLLEPNVFIHSVHAIYELKCARFALLQQVSLSRMRKKQISDSPESRRFNRLDAAGRGRPRAGFSAQSFCFSTWGNERRCTRILRSKAEAMLPSCAWPEGSLARGNRILHIPGLSTWFAEASSRLAQDGLAKLQHAMHVLHPVLRLRKMNFNIFLECEMFLKMGVDNLVCKLQMKRVLFLSDRRDQLLLTNTAWYSTFDVAYNLVWPCRSRFFYKGRTCNSWTNKLASPFLSPLSNCAFRRFSWTGQSSFRIFLESKISAKNVSDHLSQPKFENTKHAANGNHNSGTYFL